MRFLISALPISLRQNKILPVNLVSVAQAIKKLMHLGCAWKFFVRNSYFDPEKRRDSDWVCILQANNGFLQ